MSDFWSWYIIGFVAINILGCFALLHFTRMFDPDDGTKEGEATSHEYDGIRELNNPLPRWWLWMFYLSIVFSLGYVILFPGLGKHEGVLAWTQESQYEQEVAQADEKYGPIFAAYASTPIESLVHDEKAMKIGQRIFINTCFGCHGSDARGNPGYPNLADNDWLWGGSPQAIKTSVVNGRQAAMPGFGAMLSDEQVDQVAAYVSTLSRPGVSDFEVADGKQLYGTYCVACHGANGSGNVAMGAPNLTDSVWLYGGSRRMITQTIKNGRNGNMPPHGDILGNDKSHLVSAYIYSLTAEFDDVAQSESLKTSQ